MKLITNDSKTDHLAQVHEILTDSEEVFIAVAFLKLTGFDSIKVFIRKLGRLRHKVTFLVGQNFAITEPKALRALLHLKEEFKTIKAYLFKMGIPGQSFHPKIYACVKDENFGLLVGSANLTLGGMAGNQEASIYCEGKTEDKIWKDTKAYFEHLTLPKNSQELTSTLIDEYELFYNKAQSQRNNKDFEVDPTPAEFEFNVTKINSFFDDNLRDSLAEELRLKEKKYRKAKKVLDEIALLTKPGKKQFQDLFLQLTNNPEGNLLYSGGIDRHKGDYELGYRGLHKIIRAIKDSKRKSASFVFEEAMELASEIDGVSVNLVTEIMTVYDHTRFTVLNVRPVTVLKEISSREFKKSTRLYRGAEYQDFCDRMVDLTKRLKLKNLLETDLFCSSLYEEIKNKEYLDI